MRLTQNYRTNCPQYAGSKVKIDESGGELSFVNT